MLKFELKNAIIVANPIIIRPHTSMKSCPFCVVASVPMPQRVLSARYYFRRCLDKNVGVGKINCPPRKIQPEFSKERTDSPTLPLFGEPCSSFNPLGLPPSPQSSPVGSNVVSRANFTTRGINLMYTIHFFDIWNRNVLFCELILPFK